MVIDIGNKIPIRFYIELYFSKSILFQKHKKLTEKKFSIRCKNVQVI